MGLPQRPRWEGPVLLTSWWVRQSPIHCMGSVESSRSKARGQDARDESRSPWAVREHLSWPNPHYDAVGKGSPGGNPP